MKLKSWSDGSEAERKSQACAVLRVRMKSEAKASLKEEIANPKQVRQVEAAARSPDTIWFPVTIA